METRNLQLDFETAKQWFGGYVSELKDLAIKAYPELAKKELPKSWWELGNVEGFFVEEECGINFAICPVTDYSKNVFATKEQSEACIAMAQLSQLLKVYNDGWVSDYLHHKGKFAIIFCAEELTVSYFCKTRHFLTFKDAPTAKLFLENFRELIEQAKPLI
jgi:hypothetical protein